ncbi:hypothetical protein PCANC_27971, partial [Puccinia coronata f. sp. avenae]
LKRALERIRRLKEEELDYCIAFNELLKNHKATCKQRRIEQMAANNNHNVTTTAGTNKTTVVPN